MKIIRWKKTDSQRDETKRVSVSVPKQQGIIKIKKKGD